MQLLKYKISLLLLILVIVAGCGKNNEKVYPNPYAGGRSPLGVKFSEELPAPSQGSAGDKVTFKVTGLLPYKDSIHFFMSEQEAKVVAVTDGTITIIVPAGSSSGSAYVNIGQQVFQSPVFKVIGKVKLDNTFKSGTGADDYINYLLPTSDNRYLMVGAFKQYNSNGVGDPLNGIAMIEKHGQFVPAFQTDSAVYGTGSVSSAVQLPDGKFIIGGFFTRYGRMKDINQLTRINAGGLIDTTTVQIIPTETSSGNAHEDDPNATEKNSFDTVPAFNGGTTGIVQKVLYYNNRVITIGTIYGYLQKFYRNSTKTIRYIDTRRVNSVLATDRDGNLDSTYHYNLATHEGLPGANGSIIDGFLLPGGKLVLAGSFNKFDGIAAGNIVCLDANGNLDPAFRAGTGANDRIYSAKYNAVTRKIIITGNFQSYNGIPCNGIMLLNEDGSPVSTFLPKQFHSGTASHAIQLNNGLIVVAGFFNRYDNYVREGMVIINPDGTLAAGYNNTGKMIGFVYGMQETTSAEGELAVIVYGAITSFDNTRVGNIFRMVIEK
ncbi:beta-propeller uncharacterized protein DUF5122 [Chitinophaga niastensis]|uniref:Beta-propeller uncharacterized protein DUF5122 n=1 Tax=Chitinophaga niastensis TaxID=536980 RepID=A0A2P8HJ58_CHINA|nr:DUF5008 domain-containing protein [Chitinophaga niastensis]PSL46249.1 beta-propeller uncharacterized protein DUF5122 [Chitinophaga niastensis]